MNEEDLGRRLSDVVASEKNKNTNKKGRGSYLLFIINKNNSIFHKLIKIWGEMKENLRL